MSYTLSPEAEADLDEIWSFIARESRNVDIAQKTISSIADRFDLLSSYPRMGRTRDDLRPDTRSHSVDNYVIFYRLGDNGVVILRVLHGRRDLGRLLQDQ